MNAIEKEVLRYIGEDVDNPDVFGDITPIRQSVNEAIQEINMLTSGNARTVYVPLKESKIFYRMRMKDGFVGWINDGWVSNNRWRVRQTTVTELMHQNPRWMEYSGVPRWYFLIGTDGIGIHPSPVSDSYTLELNCQIIPRFVRSDLDRVFVRDSFQRAAVHYAVSEYWAGRGDAKEAIKHHGMYLERLQLKGSFVQALDYVPDFSSLKNSLSLAVT